MVLHRCRSPIDLIPLFLAVVLTALPSLSQTIYRASVATGGTEADWDSTQPSLSADGRYIAFASGAFNLVSGGTPDTTDVYMRDRVIQQTACVSVSSAGARGNGNSDSPSISADGRFIAFRSYASNLVSGDTNGVEDIFLHDAVLGTTVLVSAAPGGLASNAWSDSPVISGDGAVVAYSTAATNIVSGVATGVRNVVAWNRLSGVTILLSKAFDGSPANGDSGFPSISQDGRYIAFASSASDLQLGDSNNASDIFVADRLTSAVRRASLTSGGLQAETDSDEPAISANGRWVAFRSYATNLVARPDLNGDPDVFLHDMLSGSTGLVSIGLDGAAGLGSSGSATVSADGRYVTFTSSAANLVTGDTNAWDDVFVRDTVKASTTRLSAGDYWSVGPAMSANGVYVAFHSYADNLTVSDTNQMGDVYVAGPLSVAYSLYDAARALRIWGGLLVADPMDLPRLNLENGNPSINVSDATRITRKATGLDP